jgi:hypothetical protein
MMAGIDKIYGTQAQYDEFREWLEKNKPDAVDYLSSKVSEQVQYGIDFTPDSIRTISNFPESIDMWLLDNCPIEFIRERIKDQYNIN